MNYAPIIPRFIRLRDAPIYLGMDRNRFNAEVRPFLIQISIGSQGIAFDKLDLDAFADHYKKRNGCPGKPAGAKLWQTKRHLASLSEAKSGTLTKRSQVSEFKAALEQAASKKPKRF